MILSSLNLHELLLIKEQKSSSLHSVQRTVKDILRVRYCAQARAVENQIYTVISGTVGNLPQTENMDIQYAQSGIFAPSDFEFARDGIVGET